MVDFEIRAVSSVKSGWGESACWDERCGRLFFVDCAARELGWLDPQNAGFVGRFVLPSLPTALYLTSAPDRVLVQLDDGVYAVDPHQVRLEMAVNLPPGEPRFNDGIVDPAGGIVTGTLLYGATSDAKAGSYWRHRKGTGWKRLYQGNGNTNGPCFSPDGTLLYIADTTAGLIYRFAYDPEGELGTPTLFADTKPLGGLPDGAAMDTEGFLWMTIVGGGCLARYAPDGTVDRLIDLPTSHPTSIAFGGEKLDVAYVTTISTARPGVQPKGELAGVLLEIEGLGVQGLTRNKRRL